MTDTTVIPAAAPEPVQTDAGAAQAPEPKRSIREELEAAYQADGEKQGAAREDAPTAPVSPASQSSEAPKVRNELGQFVKQEHKAGEPKTPSASGEPRAGAPTVPSAGTEAPKPEAIAPPASWSPAAKAAFSALPDVIRQEVVKREGEINAGMAQRSQDAERLNRLHSVLGPRQERFRLAGINEAQAVEQLLAAQDLLERDPVGGLLYLARGAGVDPRHLAQVFVNGGQAQRPQAPPEVQQLYGRVQTLEQSLAQQRQAAEQAQTEALMDQVATFAADPAHTYFENVRPVMSALVRQGVPMEEAYQQAVWAHPEIRPILQRSQAEAQAKAAQDAAKSRAEDARRAAGSVTGSPAPGISPGAGGRKLSLREELERNFADLGSA